MKHFRSYMFVIAGLLGLLIQSCIHDYPKPVPGHGNRPGTDPTTMDAYLEVSYDLNWENLLHQIEFDADTKAGEDAMYRMVVEVMGNDSVVCRDEVSLPAAEFSLGHYNHKLSKPLSHQFYQIAVWYERCEPGGTYTFDTGSLSEVAHLNTSNALSETFECGFATDYLDLTDASSENKEIRKTLSMQHAGGRFEIIATDVQDFITNHRDALYQGEEYTVTLSFNWPLSQTFSLYGNEYVIKDTPVLEFSGRMRLPYAEYDELKIAEGFLFSRGEDRAELELRVSDTSLATVVRTSTFSFPLKRGYITRVRGDFLTGSLGGSLGIDHVWEGEILIEAE